MSRVLIEPASYENVHRAVEQAFTLFPTVVADKRVLIKPNVLRAARPEDGITTHPALLGAVVEKVESLGAAEIVVGDNPGLTAYGENEAAFKKTGLWEASRGHYRNIGAESRSLPFDPAFMTTVNLSRAVLEAEVLISLPKFKTHGLTVLTGAIKNSFGFLTGAQKARLHALAGGADRFQEMLVEVFRLRVPDLIIVDAVVGMEGNGPAGDDLREIGLVLASDNGVALDAVIAVMMGCDPALLPLLRRAKALGLGEYALDRIGIVGTLAPIPGFKLPPMGEGVRLQSDRVANLVRMRTAMRPRVDLERCTGCGACVSQCPVTALTLAGPAPAVDEGRCIACFCCQEICPVKAMVLGPGSI